MFIGRAVGSTEAGLIWGIEVQSKGCYIIIPALEPNLSEDIVCISSLKEVL